MGADESSGHSVRTVLLALLAWVLVAVPTAVLLFLTGSRTTVIAGHDTVVRASLDGYATLDLGPYIPNFRYETDSRLGAHLDLGATDVTSYETLIRRYALLASQPEGQIAKVKETILDLAVDSLVLGAVIGLAAPGLVVLVGRRRWSELFGLAQHWTARRGVAVALVVVVAAGAVVVLNDDAPPPVEEDTWTPLAEALPELSLPPRAARLEVEAGLITSGTKRLVQSAVDTYRTSLAFYRELVRTAPTLAGELRQPAEDEVVGILVSDRHDNVGMDPVARAVAEAAGATFLMDAGDDTSTGGSWEAFSLDSLDQAFADFDDRYAIAGNHDHGDFVVQYLDELGFTTLAGEPVEGPGGIRLLGASDVRSSGLGSWRDERDVSFDEQRELLADLACELHAEGERVSTLLVHDANSGDEALERGCVDLVLAGHLHVQVGPVRVVGENGAAGYTYTNGTTGGAAYALAIGSKLRREAGMTLVTYRDGRPIGVQPVAVSTTGVFDVGEFTPLELGAAVLATGRPRARGASGPSGNGGGGGI